MKLICNCCAEGQNKKEAVINSLFLFVRTKNLN